MKTVDLKVTAPEGRFIPGLGGREQGDVYADVPETLARVLVASDPGLSLVVPEPLKRAKPVDPAKDGEE